MKGDFLVMVTITAKKIREISDEPVYGSGTWSKIENSPEVFLGESLRTPKKEIPQKMLGFFATSTITNIPDPWLNMNKERLNLTNTEIFEPRLRRRISLLEARKIALTILIDAEAERLYFAGQEASKGIDWEQVQ